MTAGVLCAAVLGLIALRLRTHGKPSRKHGHGKSAEDDATRGRFKGGGVRSSSIGTFQGVYFGTTHRTLVVDVDFLKRQHNQ